MNTMLRDLMTEFGRLQDEVLGTVLDLFRKLNNDTTGEFLALFKKFLRGEVRVVTNIVSFLAFTLRQTVNYDRSIEESFTDGKYGQPNKYITKDNFPSVESGTREVEFGLFEFNVTFSSENAIFEIKEEGFRQATMKEMLAFGARNPKFQRKFPIVALGSVTTIDGHAVVGLLHAEGSKRIVLLEVYGGNWPSNCQFLAVRIQG